MKEAMRKCKILKILGVIFITMIVFMTSCSDDSSIDTSAPLPVEVSPDINNDGELNILVIGTSNSINNSTGAFATNQIAAELEYILLEDSGIDLEINIAFEDIYKSKTVTFGLGQAGNTFNWDHYAHSLTQYYYWPEGQTERLNNLKGEGENKWDYVVISADPYIISKTPGYYSLGVNKIASKVAEGLAKPLLLMPWPKDEAGTATIEHFSEHIYRTADGAKVAVETVPAALAWQALTTDKIDQAVIHPTPNGSYLAAASIYSHIRNKSASFSAYQYDDEIADIAMTTKTEQENTVHYNGERTFISPFKSCDIIDGVLNYNHTGTSSENGILSGLNWIINQSDRTLVNGGTPPINFNYGRANTNFEANKRYKISPTEFDFSFGFPMQDASNYGDDSMLYGLDKRVDEANNSTDLGTALYMVRNSELPYARAIPIRTLYAQIKEVIPSHSAYSDSWHMHGNLDKSVGAYIYTMLTGECVLGTEPLDQNTAEWETWIAHKIGYETAYNLMYLKGAVPNCN